MNTIFVPAVMPHHGEDHHWKIDSPDGECYEVAQLTMMGPDALLARDALAAAVQGRIPGFERPRSTSTEPLDQAQQLLEISGREALSGVVLRGHPKSLGIVRLSLEAAATTPGLRAPELVDEQMNRAGFRTYAADEAETVVGALYANMNPRVGGIVLPRNATWYDHRTGKVVDSPVGRAA